VKKANLLCNLEFFGFSWMFLDVLEFLGFSRIFFLNLFGFLWSGDGECGLENGMWGVENGIIIWEMRR
jgi:hypothetical protein